ncbi:LysR family transcriptional regulator [Sinomonas sp. ASV486]|uniref:LysR family transcriptional regulator n=1 Tax=Sinomonas sp. ASV486 TaxID=3051170 RepID=UPI0027DDD838|nr:LysR family transcriptional regulator [Sinomonas sp. ASV486]MDQ4490240.1 LysR family transcriptional regulator [Sinomonas sp. ASV486]
MVKLSPADEPGAAVVNIPSRFTLRQLGYLLTVADAGTISAAAQRLHVTQTAVGAALSDLERALGAQLLVRRRAHGAVLTPAGAYVCDRARGLLADAVDLELSSLDAGTTLRGPLALGCYSTLAVTLVPPILQGFGDAYPEVGLDFVADQQEPLERRLLGGELDAALLYDMNLPLGLETTTILEARAYALLAAGHPLAGERSVALEALADEPLVFLDLHPSGEHTLSVFRASGVTPRIRYRTTDFELTRSLVGRGLGYAILVQRPAREETYEGLQVVPVEITPAPAPVRVVMAWNAAVRPTRRARALREFITKEPFARMAPRPGGET